MSSARRTVARKLLFIPPVLLGAAVVVFMAGRARAPHRNAPTEQARRLRVIELPRVDVVPRVLGHGTAKPAQVWRTVSEVGGRIIELHPNVRAGAFLHENDVACRIDPREYELAVSRLEAERDRAQAQLAELETQAENDLALLEIEEASVTLTQLEFDRLQGLFESAKAAATELRDAELAHLAQRQAVQLLRNALRTIDRQSATMRASVQVTQTQLEQTRLDLTKTVFRVPFACRLQETDMEVGQYVQAGQLLFEADGTSAAEIDVHVPISEARTLVSDRQVPKVEDVLDFADTLARLGFSALVRLKDRQFTAEWDATPVRVREQLDPVTRTVQFVVQVVDPYAQVRPGFRPPLLRGTFCQVELRGSAIPGALVVPRAAMHEGAIYILDADNRMRRQAVVTRFLQSDFACIEADLADGTRVVVSNPTPAIIGQLVDPVPAPQILEQLIAQARAETPLK